MLTVVYGYRTKQLTAPDNYYLEHYALHSPHEPRSASRIIQSISDLQPKVFSKSSTGSIGRTTQIFFIFVSLPFIFVTHVVTVFQLGLAKTPKIVCWLLTHTEVVCATRRQIWIHFTGKCSNVSFN